MEKGELVGRLQNSHPKTRPGIHCKHPFTINQPVLYFLP